MLTAGGIIGLLGLIAIILRIERTNILLLRIDNRLSAIEQRIAGGDSAGKEQGYEISGV